MSLIGSIFNPQTRAVNRYRKMAKQVIALEDTYKDYTDEQLREKTTEFRNLIHNGSSLDSIIIDAFAVVREAAFRVLGMKHYEVQIMGGIALHEGNISEMKTGEGKTLVSTLPAYLNALSGEGVFVITVNDYLAKRDREEMGKVHEFLGLSVGIVFRDLTPAQKKLAYACDITYGTNSEFGFDYLRDNMAVLKEQITQTRRNYAIIDEVDSILIDEARTPLIISGMGNRPSQFYITVDKFVKSLKKDDDFEIVMDGKMAVLTEDGMDRAEKFFSLDHIADAKNVELLHHIRQSLQANYVMKKDQDYVVKDNEIMIVDKFTGRLMPGRSYSNGLHQAVEAKENVEIRKESKTMATITYQNYFRMFNKLSGMTGTAFTERHEFLETYGMGVVKIPTNKPIKRMDSHDRVYQNEKAKMNAIVEEVVKRHETGQPILIGTIYIDKSEQIASMLAKKGIKYNLLNAKQDENEAEIVKNAGQKGAITIATNMAGRGTDIKLGEGVEELGGLLVLGTERHESRRIDNQLRGRSGRQGDSGESLFFVSFDDSMFKRLDKEQMERIRNMVKKLGVPEDEPISDRVVSKAVENVQKNIESINFRIRKSTLEFDAILNKQRETIYNERNKILKGEDKKEFIQAIIKDIIEYKINIYTEHSDFPEEWDLESLQKELKLNLGFEDRIDILGRDENEIMELDREKLKQEFLDVALQVYDEKEQMIGDTQLRYVERLNMMKFIDKRWMDHLDLVEQLRQGVGLQGIGAQNPVRVFNNEAFSMFEEMLILIKEDTARSILTISRNEEEMAREKVNREKLKESERIERIKELEDKYKVFKDRLYKLPQNLPALGFNMDINATEEIDVVARLYYLEDGYEMPVEGYSKKLRVKGEFKVNFERIGEEFFKKGWYQVKVFVVGEEAATINFEIVDAKDLENVKKQEEQKRVAKPNIEFFPDDIPVVSFKIRDDKTKSKEALMKIVYNGNVKNAHTATVPINDGEVFVSIKEPKIGWKKGMYNVFVKIDDREVNMPFMIVNKVDKDQRLWKIDLRFEIDEVENEDAKEIEQNESEEVKDLEISKDESVKENEDEVLFSGIGQLIYIEEGKVINNMPIKVRKSGRVRFKLRKDKDNQWPLGRYEFRVISNNDVIMTKHYKVV
ncbi:MAG: preprotein translocase subunit SecA [Peptostreptococcaceae bacterium]|jgi:preprotein translocase subunit SecA|nr:preprotein translocase subunit SecA [Peptostreptococcaceae bacterium]